MEYGYAWLMTRMLAFAIINNACLLLRYFKARYVLCDTYCKVRYL